MTLLKCVFLYAGHPILFLAYLAYCGQGSLGGDGVTYFGVESFCKVGANVYKIHLGLYLLLTFPVYLLWSLAIPSILSLRRSFCLETYLRSRVSNKSLFFALPGLLNLYVWSSEGMEGNVFSFLFGLPLLGASLGYFINWVDDVIKSFQRSDSDC